LEIHPVRHDGGYAVLSAHTPVGGQAVAMTVAAVGRIQRAEPADQALLERAPWNLVGCPPVGMCCHGGDTPAVMAIFTAVAQQAVEFQIIITPIPGAVIVHDFSGI